MVTMADSKIETAVANLFSILYEEQIECTISVNIDKFHKIIEIICRRK